MPDPRPHAAADAHDRSRARPRTGSQSLAGRRPIGRSRPAFFRVVRLTAPAVAGAIALSIAAGCRPSTESTRAGDSVEVVNDPASLSPLAEPVFQPAPSPTNAPVVAAGTSAVAPAPPLANLLEPVHGIWSGGMPMGDAGFDALAELGVRTVVSVDAARPDLERANRHGIRVVHVPVTYANLEPEQIAAVARSIRDLPGPVYVHCHHGKHRGPAALAAALRWLDRLPPDAATAFLSDAGTSPRYAGLWRDVRDAEPQAPDRLLALAPDLPPIVRPGALPETMAAIDRHWDHVRWLQANRYAPLPAHPDLAAVAEAGILADLLRTLLPDAESAPEADEPATDRLRPGAASDTDPPSAPAHAAYLDDPAYIALMRDSHGFAAALEAALAASPPDLAAADAAISALGTSCRQCHIDYRDAVEPASGRG